jgi:pimeloyl-ACP methyl ester carboxylesterase
LEEWRLKRAPAPATQAARDGYIPTSDSVRLITGSLAAGPDTVLVLHGGPGFTMDYLIPDLAPLIEHHTVIFYDQRGSGRSTAPLDSFHISLGKHLADLEAVRAHFGIARLTILGHSWGGKLAAIYAAARPDRIARLILEAAGSPKPDPRFGRNLLIWADSAMRQAHRPAQPGGRRFRGRPDRELPDLLERIPSRVLVRSG